MSTEEAGDAGKKNPSKGGVRLPDAYGNIELGSRITMFQEKADKHQEKQKLNPFSSSFDAVAAAKQKLTKDDPNYGKPEGKTAERGKAAAQLLRNEVALLVEIIAKHGIKSEDGTEITMRFKELFELYKVISNKLVGLLLRARKYGLVKFEGEMLYQGRDDKVVITLDPNVSLDAIKFDDDTARKGSLAT